MKRSPLKRKTPLKRGGRLRPVSKKRAKQIKEYAKVRQEYLSLNPSCEICGKSGTQIHHKKGRFQERLNDKNFFMSVCSCCHQWIHNNPQVAYAKDYMVKR